MCLRAGRWADLSDDGPGHYRTRTGPLGGGESLLAVSQSEPTGDSSGAMLMYEAHKDGRNQTPTSACREASFKVGDVSEACLKGSRFQLVLGNTRRSGMIGGIEETSHHSKPARASSVLPADPHRPEPCVGVRKDGD